MHLFWVCVYDRTDHLHRDPVANVVIYSALALFGACLGLIFGAPAYVMLSESHPCIGMTMEHRGLYSTLDTCHFIMAFSLSIFTLVVSSMGIAAGELHRPMIYSVFGGLGFVSIWTELYSFCSIITMVVEADNRVIINALENKNTIFALSGLAIGGHGLALVSIYFAVRYAWKINFHFTRQDKLVHAERIRQRKGSEDFANRFGVAGLDDDHEFQLGGMQKGLKKMYEEKQREVRTSQKQKELQIFEDEEDRRVRAEGIGNIF